MSECVGNRFTKEKEKAFGKKLCPPKYGTNVVWILTIFYAEPDLVKLFESWLKGGSDFSVKHFPS